MRRCFRLQAQKNDAGGQYVTTAPYPGSGYSYQITIYDDQYCEGTALAASGIARIDPYMAIQHDTTVTGKVRLKWSAVTGATSYTLQRKTGLGSFGNHKTGLTGTTYDDTDGTGGTVYQYKIAAAISGVQKDFSNEVEVTFPAAATCTAGTAAVLGDPVVSQDGGIDLSWTGAWGTNCTSWEVWRAEGSNDAIKVETITTEATTTWKDTDATAGMSYTYYVSLDGDISKSNEKSVDPLTVISGVAGDGKIDLSWTLITGASYKLEESTTGTWTQIALPAVGKTTYADDTGTLDTEYKYRVRAVLSGTDKSWSNETAAIAFPSEECSDPEIESLIPTSTGTGIEISWTGKWGDECNQWKVVRGSTTLTTISTEATKSYIDLTATAGFKVYVHCGSESYRRALP